MISVGVVRIPDARSRADLENQPGKIRHAVWANERTSRLAQSYPTVECDTFLVCFDQSAGRDTPRFGETAMQNAPNRAMMGGSRPPRIQPRYNDLQTCILLYAACPHKIKSLTSNLEIWLEYSGISLSY